jgi:hypothetical protein
LGGAVCRPKMAEKSILLKMKKRKLTEELGSVFKRK